MRECLPWRLPCVCCGAHASAHALAHCLPHAHSNPQPLPRRQPQRHAPPTPPLEPPLPPGQPHSPDHLHSLWLWRVRLCQWHWRCSPVQVPRGPLPAGQRCHTAGLWQPAGAQSGCEWAQLQHQHPGWHWGSWLQRQQPSPEPVQLCCGLCVRCGQGGGSSAAGGHCQWPRARAATGEWRGPAHAGREWQCLQWRGWGGGAECLLLTAQGHCCQ